MKKIVKLLMLLCVVLVSCKTTETTDKSGQHAVKQSILIDDIIEQVLNDPTLDENERKFRAEALKSLAENKPTTTYNEDCGLLCVFPNPTSGAVTVEFGRRFGGAGIKEDEIIILDLYYKEVKINTLEFYNIKDDKVIITSDYLQKEGTYTISFKGILFASFIVKK